MIEDSELGTQLFRSRQPARATTHIVGAWVIALAALGLAGFFTYPLYVDSRPGEKGGAIFVGFINLIFLMFALLPLFGLGDARHRMVVLFENGLQIGMYEDHTTWGYQELDRVELYVIPADKAAAESEMLWSLLTLDGAGFGAAYMKLKTQRGVHLQRPGGPPIHVRFPDEETYQRVAAAIEPAQFGPNASRHKKLKTR
jgi:hypothetical protein